MQFAVAHVPGSLHIALTGQFASWAARILGLDTPLIISAEDPEHVRESQLRLARVGVENLAGYLADGVIGWIKGGFELWSSIATGILRRAGFRDVANQIGGFDAWKTAGYPFTIPASVST
jgi:3-mercaptopyruvate sulfurtransferase SseA